MKSKELSVIGLDVRSESCSHVPADISEQIRRPFPQRGSAARGFIEAVVIAMLAFSLGLGVGAALCACR